MRLLVFILLSLSLLSLTACGQSGALYFPQTEKPLQQQSKPSKQAPATPQTEQGEQSDEQDPTPTDSTTGP